MPCSPPSRRHGQTNPGALTSGSASSAHKRRSPVCRGSTIGTGICATGRYGGVFQKLQIFHGLTAYRHVIHRRHFRSLSSGNEVPHAATRH